MERYFDMVRQRARRIAPKDLEGDLTPLYTSHASVASKVEHSFLHTQRRLQDVGHGWRGQENPSMVSEYIVRDEVMVFFRSMYPEIKLFINCIASMLPLERRLDQKSKDPCIVYTTADNVVEALDSVKIIMKMSFQDDVCMMYFYVL